jgi:2'-5' RNA ligase
LLEDRTESGFADVWRERNKIQPQITSGGVDNDWAKGRNQFLTFLIRIRDEKLIRKIIEIQNKLSTIPCVDPFPSKDYLHVTVKGCGFPVESEIYEDDILIENVRAIVSQAKEVLKEFHRFNVLLPKLSIFSEVVLIEVHDEGKIGELNKGLQTVPETRKMKFDYPILLPHISIARFQNNQEFTRLISYLETLRETAFGELKVNYIDLVNANLSGKYPILKSIQTFRLR